MNENLYEITCDVYDKFNTLLYLAFKTQTIAPTEKKALSNVKYQYKKRFGFGNNYSIQLENVRIKIKEQL